MRKYISILCILLFAQAALGTENALWLRYPSISPSGNEIVFSYKGDLYRVPSTGGTATPLTLHEAHDFMPIWSPDGQQIAFASDRFGNFDVFVIPAKGGAAQRLTFNSSNDYPWDFTPDGKSIIYSSPRNDLSTSVRFPNRGVFAKLYSVPATGGRNLLLSTAGMQFARFDSKGERIIFQDRKGYEDEFRKHHTSSVTRDIWVYDTKSEKYTKVSDFEGEDREPIFSADGNWFFYLSEKNGHQNIYKRSVDGTKEVQLTTFNHHPVRYLTISNDNTLSFTWNGELYTLKEGQQPTKVAVNVPFDIRGNEERIQSVANGATTMALSPNGKEIAFVFRGEVFVTAVEGSNTKRITSTPAQERMLSWAPDGRTLYYSTERGDSWDIYSATIVRAEEPYFFASTLIREEPVIATDKEEFQPVVSPDGKEIAYLEERNTVKVFNLLSKTSRTILPAGQNFSYSDGDQDFIWSLDSKWVLVRSSMGIYGASYLVAYNAQNPSQFAQLTSSGFSDGSPQWAMDGKALLWVNDKDGKRPLALQGAREVDIFAMFFDKEAYDRFLLSKDEFALVKEREDKEKKDKEKEKDADKAKDSDSKKGKVDKPKAEKPLWVPDFTNVEDRRVKLTPGSVNLASFQISPKGDKLYFLARFEKGHDLWEVDLRTKELKSLAKLNARGGRMEISKDGDNLFVLANGRIQKVETKGGKVSPVAISAEMVVNAAAEREYIFHHAWRQVKKKFYDPNIHGIDWDMYRSEYARLLPHINNNYDFQELLSELLGELNASHTGGRYSHNAENGDATASLGLLFDERVGGKGLRITEVIKGGPLDRAESKVRAGHVIERIDGQEITDQIDWNMLLNRKVDKSVLISMLDPKSQSRWDEIVKPISAGAENNLLYNRWVETMRAMTEKLSNGRVGYVHVRGMNDGSFRTVYDEVLGKNAEKEALIVDTRFNGGGWLHEDLSTFLDGKPYATFRPYGFIAKGGEPRDKWSRPSAVLMSEGNYSDAHAFPYAYRAKGLGKLIGMPVPGTATAVWWETQIDPTIVFGIPMIAFWGVKENRALENLQLEPDVKVENPYELVLYGEDKQLQKAVEELLKEL